MSNEQVTVTRETRDRLRELRSKATPGPYRAHDHNDMARLGEDPVKWLGYAWVGRITKQSEPDGRFDAGWLDRDSRGDACKEYRMRASADAHFVAEALNALPDLLDYIDTLEGRSGELPPSLAVSPNIPWHEQTDEQLRAERDYWVQQVESAPGFASANAAEGFRRACEAELRRREGAPHDPQ